MNREQSTGGTCTWALRLVNGSYVQDPTTFDKTTFSLDFAHLWLSAEQAMAFAAKTPWVGRSAVAVRGRP